MKVQFCADPAADAPYAVVFAAARTEQVDRIMERFSDPNMIRAYSARGEIWVEESEAIRIYTENRRVMLECRTGVYQLRCRLYELEERLDSNEFIRISNSEIVSIRWIRGLDFSLTGTIRLTLKNGACCYVSRRYVAKIRKAFEG